MQNTSNFKQMTDGIVTVLTALGADWLADIRTYPTVQFNGWPAANVVPATSISDYQSISQNLRTYSFDIDLYYNIQEVDNGGYQVAFDNMRLLVDKVLDALDNSNDLNNACDFLRPMPSVWGMVETAAGSALTAKITCQCAKVVDQNNG